MGPQFITHKLGQSKTSLPTKCNLYNSKLEKVRFLHRAVEVKSPTPTLLDFIFRIYELVSRVISILASRMSLTLDLDGRIEQ